MERCNAAPTPPRSRPATCRAVIDVGSNSVKLLIGDVLGDAVVPLLERGEQTRLGEGFFTTRRLGAVAIRRTAEAAGVFAEEARRTGASTIRLVATAAAREAANRDELITALRTATGLEPEVLAGETEAALAFRGVGTTPGLAGMPLLVTDLGGGSTEFIVGRDGLRRFSRSVPLGAVRLFDQLRLPDPPTEDDLRRCRSTLDAFLQEQVAPGVSPALSALARDAPSQPVRYVAVGGTALILARLALGLPGYDRQRLEQVRLDGPAVRTLVERLWALPLAERRCLPGLPPERADIMLAGAVIHERILAVLDLPALSVSTRGLRFAALLDPEPTP